MKKTKTLKVYDFKLLGLWDAAYFFLANNMTTEYNDVMTEIKNYEPNSTS